MKIKERTGLSVFPYLNTPIELLGLSMLALEIFKIIEAETLGSFLEKIQDPKNSEKFGLKNKSFIQEDLNEKYGISLDKNLKLSENQDPVFRFKIISN